MRKVVIILPALFFVLCGFGNATEAFAMGGTVPQAFDEYRYEGTEQTQVSVPFELGVLKSGWIHRMRGVDQPNSKIEYKYSISIEPLGGYTNAGQLTPDFKPLAVKILSVQFTGKDSDGIVRSFSPLKVIHRKSKSSLIRFQFPGENEQLPVIWAADQQRYDSPRYIRMVFPVISEVKKGKLILKFQTIDISDTGDIGFSNSQVIEKEFFMHLETRKGQYRRHTIWGTY